MEEQNVVSQQSIQPEPAVSFPDPKPSRQSSSFPKWIFAVIGLVIILAAGGFFLYQSSTTTTNPTPSPFVSGIDTLPTPTETPIPTKTPSATVAPTPSSAQRTSVSIEVQNGTGTTGDASLAKSAIEKAGYTKVTTGNAANQNATSTTLTYSSDVPLAVVTEVSQSLSSSFGTVSTEDGLTGKMVIRVITGPKAKADSATRTASPTTTAKASATPTAKASSSPTPTASSTAKASATPTATP